MAVSTFPQNLTLKIENFSSENATFPQNDGKLFLRASKIEEKLPTFPQKPSKRWKKSR